MSPPAITSPFTEPPQSFGTEGLNILKCTNSEIDEGAATYDSRLAQKFVGFEEL